MNDKVESSNSVIIEIIKILPDIFWVILSFIIFIYSYKVIREQILPNMKNVSAFGVTVELLRGSIDAIVEVAEKNDKWEVNISKEKKENVINRAKLHLEILRGSSILWFDDRPETLVNEIKMFSQIGMNVDIVSTLEEVIEKLKSNKYDMMITDIARDNSELDGITTLKEINSAGYNIKTIFYVGVINSELGTPAHGFGITNSPDELLHLVIDIVERK